MADDRFIDVTEETARAFVMRGIKGPVVMLNLLRFREKADYSGDPGLAPDTAITGAEAYDLYIAHTEPFLSQSGGKVLFSGSAAQWLIGPQSEYWHRAILIQQASVQSFLGFASNPDYLAGLGHRTAALEDARLLPILPD